MEPAKSAYVIKGVGSTVPFHQHLMRNERLRTVDFS